MVESITQRIVNRYNRIHNLPPIDASGVPLEFQAGLYQDELDDFIAGETNPIEFFADFVDYVRAETLFAFHDGYITVEGAAELAANTKKYPFFTLWFEIGYALVPYRYDRWNKKYYLQKVGRSGISVPSRLNATKKEQDAFYDLNRYEFWIPQEDTEARSLSRDSIRTDFQNHVLQVSQVSNQGYDTMYKLLATGPVIAALPEQVSARAVRNWRRGFNLFESFEHAVQAAKEGNPSSLLPVK